MDGDKQKALCRAVTGLPRQYKSLLANGMTDIPTSLEKKRDLFTYCHVLMYRHRKGSTYWR